MVTYCTCTCQSDWMDCTRQCSSASSNDDESISLNVRGAPATNAQSIRMQLNRLD